MNIVNQGREITPELKEDTEILSKEELIVQIKDNLEELDQWSQVFVRDSEIFKETSEKVDKYWDISFDQIPTNSYFIIILYTLENSENKSRFIIPIYACRVSDEKYAFWEG